MADIAGETPGFEHEHTLRGAGKAQRTSTLVAVPRLSVVVRREGGKPAGRRLELEGERIRVGCYRGNELVLEDRQTSLFHCLLTLVPGGWRLTDTSSATGTSLNGVQVRDASLPSIECEIALGDSALQITPLASQRARKIYGLDHFGELRGNSPAMRDVFSELSRVGPSDVALLVQGESGTGKELVAHEIVRGSVRAHGPLVTFDCSACAPALSEGELFGYAGGARPGAFQAAEGGTLFLEEVGELPLATQQKLLRALVAQEVRRVGEDEARRVDVRVIASSSRELEREVNRGRFLEELYARLCARAVRLPPLRERAQDIPDLVTAFLERLGASPQAKLFTPDVCLELARHDWPGNVRELRQYVERSLLANDARGPSVDGSAEPPRAERSSARRSDPDLAVETLDGPFKNLKERLVARFERAYLERLMLLADGNVSRAARTAQLDRMYLHRLLQRHAIARSGQDDDAPSGGARG